MLRLVLKVFLYVIITFNCLNAAELHKTYDEHTENHKITRANTVEPLDNIDTLETNSF